MSLADVFGTPAVAGLGGILPKNSSGSPATPPPQPPEEDLDPAPNAPQASEEQPAPDPEETEDEGHDRVSLVDQAAQAPSAPNATGNVDRRPRPRRSPPEPVDEEDPAVDVPAQISVYLLPAAIAAIRKRRNGRTNAQIAFAAITAERERLSKLVAEHRTPGVTAPAGLFAPQPSDRGPAAGQERRVLWTFKATRHNRTVLDQLTKEVGADSRSELVAAALEAHVLHSRRR